MLCQHMSGQPRPPETMKPLMPTAPSPLKSAPVPDWLAPLLAAHAHQPGALLPLLHAVQDLRGYIPTEAVQPIARALNLSRAEVHGVITYYHFFRTTPPGKHVVQVCRAESCQACGSEALMSLAEKTLGCASHSTREDGQVSLEPVYCLGLCSSSPAIQIDERLHARVTPERLTQLLSKVAA
jgi:formate dehydrogenase subunit gamma